jgi:redox-sensitive bicupin YhaK (pirin superfamily)
MPAGAERCHGIQLWINLARRDKGMIPAYQRVEAHEMPEREIAGGRLRTVVGPGSPLTIHTPMEYVDVSLDAESVYIDQLDANQRGIIYLLAGEVEVNDQQLLPGESLLYTTNALQVRSRTASRFIQLSGQPHNEPIFQNGTNVD